MLAKIRNATGSLISIFLIVGFAFVAFVFMDFGQGTQQNTGPQNQDVPVGEIDGVEIMLSEFDRQVRSRRDAYQNQTGQPLPEGMAETVRDGIWKSSVEQIVAGQQIESMGLQVSDAMLEEEIIENPPAELRNEFMDESGQFNEDEYQNAIVNGGERLWLPVEDFVRNTVLPRRLWEEMANATIRVTSNEVETRFQEDSEKVSVRFMSISSSDVSDDEAAPSDDEVQAFYDENQDRFEEPTKATLSYVKLDKGPGQSDIGRGQKRIKTIYEKVQNGTSFSRLARIHSDDPGSASEGGDLGWFPRGQMAPEFDAVAFALEPGQISEPFRSSFGWHIIQLEEVRESTPEIEGGEPETEIKAAHILKEVKASPSTIDSLYQALISLAESVSAENGSLASSDDFGPLVKETPPFSRPTASPGRPAYIPTLGALSEAVAFSFNEPVGTLSSVLENDESFFLLELKSRVESHIRPLSDVRQRVESLARREKKKTLALEQGQALAQTLEEGASFDEAAQALGLEIQEPAPFARSDYVAGIGTRTRFTGVVFSLDKGATSEAVVVEDRGITAVAQVLDRIPADQAELVDQRNDLEERLRNEKTRNIFQAWLDHVKTESEIVDHRDEYYGTVAADPSDTDADDDAS